MNCPRCGLRNPDSFAFCMRCAAPLVSPSPWSPEAVADDRPAVLVGRDVELAELQAAVRGLLAGQGGIVSVIGAAGLGKTRLAAELHRWTRQHTRALGITPPAWLPATCYPPGETPGVPGLRVGSQWLRAHLGPVDEPVAQLEQAVRARLPDEAGFVLHYLANLVSPAAASPGPEAPPATEPGQRHVFEAFSRVLSALSQQAPLVLLVEEMHWIDESSAALLEHVWPLSRQQPILFVLLYEPEEERRCWELRRQAANLYADSYREVFLHPLSNADAGQLLDLLLSGAYVPPAAYRAVLQTTRGNPLFLKEIVLWKRAVGLGTWLDEALPDTLPDVLAARTALLGPGTRRILQIAAVIGPVFSRHTLAHVLMLDGQGEDALQHLQQIQVLEMIHPHSSPDAPHAYAFTHQFVRQAAYESLAESERGHLHLLAAQAIEEHAGDGLAEHYAVLAHHYTRALRFDQALQYVRGAGDQALWRYADDEAMAYYQAGLRLATAQPHLEEERRGLLRRIATIHARRGQWLDNIRAHEHVLATQADDPVGQAETYQDIAQAHRCLGDREAEGYYVQRALAALPSDAPASLQVSLLLAQSNVAWARGDHPVALAGAQQALALTQQTGDITLLVLAWNQIGAAHVLSGDDAQAREAFLYALDACESVRVAHDARLRTYLNAGKMQVQIMGDLVTAQDLFERALALARRVGYDVWAMWAHFSLAELAFTRGRWTYAEEQVAQGEDLCTGRNLAPPRLRNILLRAQLLLARGQPQAAYERFRHAAEAAEALGDTVQGLIPARLGQALALWALGRLEPASLLLEQTLHLSQQEGTLDNVATTYFHLARCLLARDDVAAARRVYDSVTPSLTTLQRPWVQAQDLWLRGLLAAAEGRAESAEHDLLACQRVWQRHGYRYEEGQVLLDLTRFYQVQGRAPEAVQSRDEAIALFQLLGAAGDLAQAEALELAE